MSSVNTPGSAGQNPPPGNMAANPIANFDQPVLAVVDPKAFNAVRAAIEESFSAVNVTRFLQSVERQHLRIRNFEAALSKGLLGASARAEYAALGNADQGQIREFYLASLERVASELRTRFFKLYAYY